MEQQTKKQTAVEQFLDAIKNQISLSNEHLEMIESYASQAKEMERIQIIDASATAYKDMFGANGNEYGENYYNKKFNN